jgi:general secretion pathway protein G
MQRTKRIRSRRRGFTLLEILLVVAIIALLAAFVVPTFMNTELGAKIDITKNIVTEGGVLDGVLELYRMNVGQYPPDLKELLDKPDDEARAAKWRGPYIKSADRLKDACNKDLKYKFPGEYHQNGYDLWSVGPDGEDGTEDDIANWTKEK